MFDLDVAAVKARLRGLARGSAPLDTYMEALAVIEQLERERDEARAKLAQVLSGLGRPIL